MTELFGTAATFFGIFFAGLALNLTPCVYPMISVTASLFTAQKDSGIKTSFVRALSYVLGIMVMNTALGVTAALTGALFGALLQNTWVLLGISAMMLVLALSMFGWFHVQAPAWLLNKLTGKRSSTFIGLFFSGLVVGIFAAPCIGPPMIALLTYVGTEGDLGFAILVFAVLSAGLGLPYLLLGTFSGLLKKLPKSGVWLLWMEKLFGVILLGLAGFYFLLAVYPGGLTWLIPGMLAFGGIYLGFFDRSAAYSEAFNLFRKTLGVAMVAAALILPALAPKGSVQWEPYSAEKFSASIAQGKPVILDFYADWCIPCHELDRFTYSDSRVIEALQSFDRYKVDLTDQETEEAVEAVEKFNLEGVPTVAFFDRSGKEVTSARISGFYGPEDFLNVLASTGILSEKARDAG